MSLPEFYLRPPSSKEEWDTYFQLRHSILRAPLNLPIGSERDKLEEVATHAAHWAGSELTGIGRLHMVKPGVGQIRYMAVETSWQGTGIGKKILQHLEAEARKKQLVELFLHARKPVVDFYLRCGYQIEAEIEPILGIAHVKMKKVLEPVQ